MCHEKVVLSDLGQMPLKNLTQESIIARYLFLKIIWGKIWKIDLRKGS